MKRLCTILLMLSVACAAHAWDIPATDAERDGAPLERLREGFSLYIEQGDLPGAEAMFRKAVEEAPDNVLARLGLEYVLSDAGQTRAALAEQLHMVRTGAWGPWMEVILESLRVMPEYGASWEEVDAALATRLERENLAWVERALLRQRLGEIRLRQGRIDETLALAADNATVRAWRVLGPFANRDRSGFLVAQPVESWHTLDWDEAQPGRGRSVSWFVSGTEPDGYLPLSLILSPARESMGYAVVLVEASEAMEATLVLGGEGASQLWVNGAEVYRDGAYENRRGLMKRLVPIQLRAGQNLVALKIAGDPQSGMGTAARILPMPPAILTEPGSADAADARAGLLSFHLSAEALAAYRDVAPDPVEPPEGNEAVRGLTGLDWGGLAFFSALAEDRDAGTVNPLAASARIYLILMRELDNELHDRTRGLAERMAAAYPRWSIGLQTASLVQADENEKRALLVRAVEIPGAYSAKNLWVRKLLDTGFLREAEKEARALLEHVRQSEAPGVLYAIDRKREWTAEAHAWARRMAEELPLSARSSQALLQTTATVQEQEAIARNALERTGTHRRVLADLLLRRGEVEESRALYRTEVILHPFDAEGWERLAETYLVSGDFDGALAVLEEARTHMPQSPVVLERIARTALRAGDTDGAMAAMEASLAIRTDNPALRELFEELQPEVETFYAAVQIDFDDLDGQDATPEAYPEYNALTLLDQGYVRVNENGTEQRMIRSVTKVLRPDAVRRSAQEAVYYDPERQRVEVVHARVIQPDGSVVENARIFDQTYGGGGGQGTVYSSYMVRVISLNQVRPGSIVDLQYVVEDTDVGLYNDEFETNFYIGGDSPTLRFEYTVNLPASMTVQAAQTDDAYAHTDKVVDGRRILRWQETDLPGIRIEPMMPPFSELVPSLKVTSFESWDDVGRWFWALSEQQMQLPDDIKAKAHELVADATTREETIQAIFRFILDEIRYVSISFGVYGCKPHTAERTYRARYGDCKDTAILFVAMLREVGIEAFPVLVRTFDLGDEPTGLPSARTFNHAIAYVPPGGDGEPAFWLDGTAQYFAFGMIPSMDRDTLAIIIRPDGAEQVRIPAGEPDISGARDTIEAVLQHGGAGTLHLRQDQFGEFMPGMRGAFTAPERLRHGIQQFTQMRFAGSELTDFRHATPDPEAESFFAFSVASPTLATREGAAFRIVPVVFPAELSQRFAGMTDRKHDLMIGIRMQTGTDFTLRLPEGAVVESVPEPLAIESPYVRYERTVERDGMVIRIGQTVTILERRVPAADYAAFSEVCNRITAAQQEAVVYRDPPGTGEASGEGSSIDSPAGAQTGADAEGNAGSSSGDAGE